MTTGGHLILDFTRERVRVTSLGRQGSSREKLISMAEVAAAVKEFKEWHASLGMVSGVTIFIPSALCRFRIGTFPSKNNEELREIFRLQFARTTPHGRDEILVDVKVLSQVSRVQSQAVSVMVTRESLAPVLLFCADAGLLPDIVTVHAQQLVVLAEKTLGAAIARGARIVAMVDEKILYTALLVNGVLVFAREGILTEDLDRQLSHFIDHCRKELPEVPIQAGLVFDENAAEQTWDILGVPLVTKKLSVANVFPTLASFQHVRQEHWFDLSPAPVVEARRIKVMKQWGRQGMLLGGLLLTGIIFLIAAGTITRLVAWTALDRAIKGAAAQVRELENKNKFINDVRHFSEGRILLSGTLEDVALALPVEVRLTECRLVEGRLSVHGESSNLEAVRSFQESLSSKGRFRNVMIGGINKRPVESGEVVLFTLTAETTP